MATYLKNEELYREIVRAFLGRDVDAGSLEESGFCEVLDQIFTACDCYDPEPEEKHEINDAQLLSEVSQLAIKRWGTI